MAYPNTDWPTSIDATLTRVNGVDIIDDDDFNYQDEQFRVIQAWLGINGDFIGDDATAAHGPGGVASPIADGGIAFTIAAKKDFTSGKLLSIVDNYDAAASEKVYVDFDGLIYTVKGLLLGATTQVDSIFDEDNMASDSATALATQQSIKKYVDDSITGVSTYWSRGGTVVYPTTAGDTVKVGDGVVGAPAYAYESSTSTGNYYNAATVYTAIAGYRSLGLTVVGTPGTDVSSLTIYHSKSASSHGTGDISILDFAGVNDALADTVYGRIVGVASDVSAGSEDGGLDFYQMVGGSLENLLSFKGYTLAGPGLFSEPSLYLGDGDVSTPTYGFTTFTDRGMFSGSGLGFAVGGTEYLRVTTSGAIHADPGTAIVGGYESLVVTDDILTNKKYVDDAITTATGAGTDTTAIHNSVAGEINAIAPKSPPVGADVIVIEDSADSWAKKSVTLTDVVALAGGGGIDTYADVATAEALNGVANNTLIYIVSVETFYRCDTSSGATRDGYHVLNVNTVPGPADRFLAVSGFYRTQRTLSQWPTVISNGTLALGNGALAGASSGGYITAIGQDACGNTNGGQHTTVVGAGALDGATVGIGPVEITAIGSQVLQKLGGSGATGHTLIGAYVAQNAQWGTSDTDNTLIGRRVAINAGTSVCRQNTIVGAYSTPSIDANNNSVFGYHGAFALTNGDYNDLSGSSVCPLLSSGSSNTIKGAGAGANLTIGSGNVYIGRLSGPTTNGSNELYIHNATSDTPLIYGSFAATKKITFNLDNSIVDFTSTESLFQNDGTAEQVVTIERLGSVAEETLGYILFRGINDAGSPESIEYAMIRGRIGDITDGTEDGTIDFRVMVNGSMTSHFSVEQNYLRADNAGGGMLRSAAGSAALPAVSFRSYSNSGMFYNSGSAYVGIASAGVERCRFSTDGSYADPGHYDKVQTLTSGATISVDCQDGFNCYLLLGNNANAIQTPTNPEEGMILRFVIEETSASAYSFDFSSDYRLSASLPASLGQDSSFQIGFIYITTDSGALWLELWRSETDLTDA